MVPSGGIEPLSTKAPVLQTGDPTIDLFGRVGRRQKVLEMFVFLKGNVIPN